MRYKCDIIEDVLWNKYPTVWDLGINEAFLKKKNVDGDMYVQK